MRSVRPLLAAFIFILLRGGSSGGVDSTRSRGVATCTELLSALGASIVVSSGPEYNAGVSATWNFFNTQPSPACIVYPNTTSHVQAAMKAIFQNNVRYAVRAGGHSAGQGWNMCATRFLNAYLDLTSRFDQRAGWHPYLVFQHAERHVQLYN